MKPVMTRSSLPVSKGTGLHPSSQLHLNLQTSGGGGTWCPCPIQGPKTSPIWWTASTKSRLPRTSGDGRWHLERIRHDIGVDGDESQRSFSHHAAQAWSALLPSVRRKPTVRQLWEMFHAFECQCFNGVCDSFYLILLWRSTALQYFYIPVAVSACFYVCIF